MSIDRSKSLLCGAICASSPSCGPYVMHSAAPRTGVGRELLLGSDWTPPEKQKAGKQANLQAPKVGAVA